MPKFTKQLKQTIHKIYTTLKKAGFDDISIAGMLGNALAESSLNPDSISKSNYHGLWQNSNNLHNAVIGTYGNHNIDTQLRYVIDWTNAHKTVTKGKHRDWLATGAGKFKKTGYKNAEEASDAFMKLYERPVILDKSGNVLGYQKDVERKVGAVNMYDYINQTYNGNRQITTITTPDGNKKMVFEKPDWAKSKTEIPNQYMPRKEVPGTFDITNQSESPYNSWKGADSLAYGGYTPRIPDIQEINAKNQKDILDVFEKAAVAYGLDKSILPSLSSLMLSPEEILKENRKLYFRDILNVPSLTADYSPTFHKFIIPKANRGKDKLPRFDEGTPYTVGPYNVYPSALDEQELLNVQTPNINIIGTDRRPLYQRYDAPNSVYDPNAIRNITDWTPGIGDVSQGFDAVNAFKNNQYEQAALAGGLLLLPNALEPVVKPLVRGLSKFKNSIIGKITGSVPPPTYGNGSYAALSRRYEPEELKTFSKNNPIREYYGQNYDLYPEEIKKSIYNSVYNRMNIARNDSEFANDFANAFTQKYTTYSGEPFKRSFGGDMYGGMYFDNSDHIAIRDGKTDYALGHETVHQLDKKLGRTTKEKAFLEDAFDSDFLKGASEHERTATNYDSRKRFLGNTIDSNSSLDVLNKIIDAATDDEVFDAVSKSNPYGKRYIEEKRKNGQLNSALANKIKESWKYVGMYGGAGGALYMLNDVTEEDLENAMREVGILAPLLSLGLYNKGKDIYIKPSKRGTFTAAAKKHGLSVQGFASKVLANPGKYSKAMRKKALFAKNASKWSH